MMRWLLTLLVCGGGLGGCTPDRPTPVSSEQAGAVPLALPGQALAELELPEHNRPADAPDPPRDVAVQGPWRAVATHGGRTTWETALPIRPRALFFFRALPGMALRDGSGAKLPYRTDHGGQGQSWRFNSTTLTLTRPTSAGPPAPGEYTMRYPRATERERRLNLASFQGEPEDFVRASLQVGPATRSGLLLPAPGTAAWDVEVPPAAELHLAVGLVPPETVDGPPSDGAVAIVEVEAGGRTTELARWTVQSSDFEPRRLSLARYEGEQLRLRLRTEPGESRRFDYVLFADPVLSSRQADPQRVVIVFVDTLRPDHLGLYGYERPTSPTLDALGEQAVVFEAARSVAPWTLPSTRTMVSGRHPERYDSGDTLQRRLRERGWATAMFAGNVYLSSNFDMDRDWGMHWVVNKPPAADQVDRAIEWLQQQDGRDALLLLHFMDVHLPFQEPLDYRFLFAGLPQGELGERFSRGTVLRARPQPGPEQDYVVDRYDNTIRYVDDELSRLFRRLSEQDIIVYTSDHGEEFWEHGGYEHGHTLYDELLWVPFVLRAPGLPPGRVDAPISLLDLSPTLLDLLGLPVEGMDGRSLVPAARGQAGAEAELAERSQVFGRPLYGRERWGVLSQGQKWMTQDNRSELYDLQQDPGEQHNLLRSADDAVDSRFQQRATEALGRPLVRALRLYTGYASRSPKQDLVATLHVPGGVSAAWVGADPTNKSSAEVRVDGERVVATWHRGHRGGREVFVLPTRPLPSLGEELRLEVRAGGTHRQPALRPIAAPLSGRSTLARLSAGGRRLQLTLGVAPLPADDVSAIIGYDPEVESMLQALGYMEEEP